MLRELILLPLGEGGPKGRMWVGYIRRRKPPLRTVKRLGRMPPSDPQPFAQPIATLPGAQALSQWEKDDEEPSEVIYSCMMAGRRTAFARAQRQAASLAEHRLWQRLRSAQIDGHRFRRQHPVGRYFADFACDRLRLILEIDGGIHDRDDVILRDHLRQVELETLGWTVLRFSNEVALSRPERIIGAIRKHAGELGV